MRDRSVQRDDLRNQSFFLIETELSFRHAQNIYAMVKLIQKRRKQGPNICTLYAFQNIYFYHYICYNARKGCLLI